MNSFLNLAIIVWPFVVSLLAAYFHNKQNSKSAWTGGPISWPKSFWLAYTTSSWFLLPILLFCLPEFPAPLKLFFVFHLLSWWIRGPLELVMIYKWLNWTPRYGISHDLFHIIGCVVALLFGYQSEIFELNIFNLFAMITIFATGAEVLFAYLFLRFRSEQEQAENIYFASDDPKWILINRITFTVVVIVMAHLLLQSFLVFTDFFSI